LGKRKNMLIKHDISRYIETISGNMKTMITFMKRTIAKKNTPFGPKFQFTFVVWAYMRPASTPKHLKEGIIRLFMKKKFNRNLYVENTSGSTVDEKTDSGEGITPKQK
jgi:hypothetical protein